MSSPKRFFAPPGASWSRYRAGARGRPNRYVESMAAAQPPVVRGGLLAVPQGPGPGLTLNPDVLRANLVDGEPWWG